MNHYPTPSPRAGRFLALVCWLLCVAGVAISVESGDYVGSIIAALFSLLFLFIFTDSSHGP